VQTQDLANAFLSRLRQRGINWGGQPQNNIQDYNPPNEVLVLMNTAYNEFLSDTKDTPIAALKIPFLSVANAMSYPLNPVPTQPPTNQASPLLVQGNPFALCVYECTYSQQTSAFGVWSNERYIPIQGTPRFRAQAGAYQRRYANYGTYPESVAQLFGRQQLDVLPGTAVAGDLFQVTICPDPLATYYYYVGSVMPAGATAGTMAPTAAQGGALVMAKDVPLFPSQFHMAIVEKMVEFAADAADKTTTRDFAAARYKDYVERAREFGSAYGEGDAEQVVTDTWSPLVFQLIP